ncbi:hypothetical protein H072_7078 [Dactylellina haptotyla CBS 200.50]|uniref:Rhodopsin domain-containing protein n=1 Tax=Dactylellina haptotyla (strain CBS 200.50) TaxID=1284197 RepID=S8A7X8_DACHA|nr:hypothetical protein H072_7078 [Dactylellina haptotyla CBS 200.50]
MKWVSPPNLQTDVDREYLKGLFPLFKMIPPDFKFPLEVDPNYRIPVNTFYCFVTGIIVCALTTVVVILRFWARARVKGSFGPDDWVMVPTFICYSAFNIVNVYAVFGTGLGYHLYDNSRKDIEKYLVSTTNYGVFMGGHIVLDALTIFPPLSVLFRLPMTKAKKFNLGFLLVLGIFTMVFSALKPFVFYRIMVDSFDITWNATAVAFWGILESSLAILIACLPALNRGIIKFTRLDKFFSSSAGSKMLSNRFRLKGENIYKGPAKFVRYKADATVHDTMQSYLELGSLGETKSEERLRRRSSEEDDLERKGSQSYPRITVERSFHLTEERASVLEQEIAEDSSQGKESVELSRPPKARMFGGASRRASPPSPDDSQALTKQ